MHHIYYPKEHILGNSIVVNISERVHYLYDVLRLHPKDVVVLFDGEGMEYICKVEKVASGRIDLQVSEKRRAKKIEPKITIACAIPKKSKMDDIIDKLTQLGVHRVIPMLTERVNVEWAWQQKQKHISRWRKIAISASEQSARAYLPVIDEIQGIKTVLSRVQDFDLKLIPTLIDRKVPLKEILSHSKCNSILALIGPEGDFTPEEVAFSLSKGCVAVSLGDLVLRVETAAVAVASYIRLNEENR